MRFPSRALGSLAARLTRHAAHGGRLPAPRPGGQQAGGRAAAAGSRQTCPPGAGGADGSDTRRGTAACRPPHNPLTFRWRPLPPRPWRRRELAAGRRPAARRRTARQRRHRPSRAPPSSASPPAAVAALRHRHRPHHRAGRRRRLERCSRSHPAGPRPPPALRWLCNEGRELRELWVGRGEGLSVLGSVPDHKQKPQPTEISAGFSSQSFVLVCTYKKLRGVLKWAYRTLQRTSDTSEGRMED